jgi:hypothetical protein
MEHVNEKILEDYRLVVSRLDFMKAEVDEVNRANNKMRKAFIDLLELYQGELDRRDYQYQDREETEYYWLEKAGILD